MPMIDLTIPAGGLADDARDQLAEALTAALLRHEGAPDNERTRALTWVFMHECPAGSTYVGGRVREMPVYRLVVTVPEGTLLHGPGPFGTAGRRALVADLTSAVLAAEGGEPTPADRGRVYCVIREVPDGYWGALGQTVRMEDIASIGADEAATPVAREAAEAIDALLLAAAGD